MWMIFLFVTALSHAEVDESRASSVDAALALGSQGYRGLTFLGILGVDAIWRLDFEGSWERSDQSGSITEFQVVADAAPLPVLDARLGVVTRNEANQLDAKGGLIGARLEVGHFWDTQRSTWLGGEVEILSYDRGRKTNVLARRVVTLTLSHEFIVPSDKKSNSLEAQVEYERTSFNKSPKEFGVRARRILEGFADHYVAFSASYSPQQTWWLKPGFGVSQSSQVKPLGWSTFLTYDYHWGSQLRIYPEARISRSTDKSLEEKISIGLGYDF